MLSNTLGRGIAAATCIALIGCATSEQTAGMQCGLGAAAAAYLACKALHKQDAVCVGAATVFGLGGAAACYSYAAKLEKRRKELAGHENDLDRRIAYVRGLNQDAQQLDAELDKRVALVTQSTDTLVSQIQQRRITQDQLEKERKARDDEIKQARTQVNQSGEALREVRTYRAQLKQPSPDLDVAIARQQQLYDDANRQVLLLAAQRARV